MALYLSDATHLVIDDLEPCKILADAIDLDLSAVSVSFVSCVLNGVFPDLCSGKYFPQSTKLYGIIQNHISIPYDLWTPKQITVIKNALQSFKIIACSSDIDAEKIIIVPEKHKTLESELRLSEFFKIINSRNLRQESKVIQDLQNNYLEPAIQTSESANLLREKNSLCQKRHIMIGKNFKKSKIYKRLPEIAPLLSNTIFDKKDALTENQSCDPKNSLFPQKTQGLNNQCVEKTNRNVSHGTSNKFRTSIFKNM